MINTPFPKIISRENNKFNTIIQQHICLYFLIYYVCNLLIALTAFAPVSLDFYNKLERKDPTQIIITHCRPVLYNAHFVRSVFSRYYIMFSNSRRTSSSVFSNVSASSQSDNLSLLFKSTAFYNIQLINSEFLKGNYSYLTSNFTNTEYLQYTNELYKLKALSNAQTYDQVRSILLLMLENLQKTTILLFEKQNMEYLISSNQEKLDMLNDISKLTEYLEKLKFQTSFIFPESNVKVATVKMNPTYLKYIELYGFPQNGIFDGDKLARIDQQFSVTV